MPGGGPQLRQPSGHRGGAELGVRLAGRPSPPRGGGEPGAGDRGARGAGPAAPGHLPLLPSQLRRPDAQAAPSGRGRRLPDGDARQPQQPRPRRRAGDGGAGARDGGRPRRDVPLPRRVPRAPHLERDDRQPGGALRRPRAEAGRRHRSRRGGPLHSRADVPAARRADRPGARRRPGAHRPRGTGAVLRTDTIGTAVLTAGTTGLGAVDPIDEALALRERYGVRLHVDAAYGGFHAIPAWSGSADVPAAPYAPSRSATRWWSTPTSTASNPTAAAACSSATPRWAASTSTTRRTPTSPPPSSTSARSAWSAPGRGPRPPRCGPLSSSSPSPTRGWARSSPPAGGRPHAWPA